MDAQVAKILDTHRVVLNVGELDHVFTGQAFIIYEWGEEVKDPSTGRSLGRLEILKGRGEIVHVQEKMSILKSTGDRFVPAGTLEELLLEADPLKSRGKVPDRPNPVRVGDFAKPIG